MSQKKENNEDIFDRIFYVVLVGLVFFWIIAMIFSIFNIIIENFELLMKLMPFILIILFVSLLVCRKDFSKFLSEEKKKKEIKKNEKIKQKTLLEEIALKESIDSIRFINIPKKLSPNQEKKLLEFMLFSRNYIEKKYFILSTEYPCDLKNEELYTLLFINRDTVEIKCYTDSTNFVEVYVRAGDEDCFILENEIILSEFLKNTVVVKKAKNTRTSTKVKELRKQRKNKELIRINGKNYQPPNYAFIAKEWIVANMGYLNNIFTNEMNKNKKVIEVIVPSDKLPEDNIAWKYIGEKLVSDKEIDKFELISNGLKIIVNI